MDAVESDEKKYQVEDESLNRYSQVIGYASNYKCYLFEINVFFVNRIHILSYNYFYNYECIFSTSLSEQPGVLTVRLLFCTYIMPGLLVWNGEIASFRPCKYRCRLYNNHMECIPQPITFYDLVIDTIIPILRLQVQK